MTTLNATPIDNAEAATSIAATLKPRKKHAKADGEATIGVDVGNAATGAKTKSTKTSATKTVAAKTVATKADTVLKLLRTAKGSTIEAMMQATGWQAHSVRGFLSAVVRKKLNLNLSSEVNKDGQRRYRIDDSAKAG